MKHHPSIMHASRIVYTIIVIGFVYTLHMTLPAYVNSSFLGLFTDERTIGLLYTLAAVSTIIALFMIGKILTRFGNYKTSVLLILFQIVLFYGFLTAQSFWLIAIIFILSSTNLALIGLNIDIFLQKYSEAGHVGGIRGLFMGANNGAWVIAPLIGGALIAGIHYRNVYATAFGLLFVLLYFIYKNMRNFQDPQYGRYSLYETLSYVLKKENLSKLFAANILLNIFYGWMVIYMPIYLHETIGFNWDQIGIILTIMLLPFVIFEFPAGLLADSGWGEKKIMTLGFVIIGLSTCALAFITMNTVLVWGIALFITRIGASMAESMIGAYFFKSVGVENEDLLSTFWSTRYISYIVAPAITTVGLYFNVGAANLFIILGLITLWALRYTLTIKDIV